ncbi:MAG: ATP-binding protein [Rhodocyclaceae bacterium]|nr:ATP-binding protein [Rhodocyclaceae bacterium]
MTNPALRPRERNALIQSLRAGVTPRLGARHIQVGRDAEIAALDKDLERIADGGSAFRLVIGEYGSGKTFFLNLLRGEAMERQLVVAHADLNPGRRLQSSGGEARSLYAELMKNMATRTKPEGGALTTIVEKFITTALSEARKAGKKPEDIIHERLENLSELVMGYDFATVIAAYWRAYEKDDDTLKANAIRWLRGEFSAKTDARHALGVREIIGDAALYDQIKLLARFCRLAGYQGLLICLDELVNLYKLANPLARNGNYEQILRILNDLEQGSAEGLGFILGGTPEFLTDPRRGLYSYPALQSRLAENPFARNGLVDLSGPVLRLNNLSRKQFFALLGKLNEVYHNEQDNFVPLPAEALPAFMGHCEKKLGEATFRTPRTTIKAFIDLLAVLEQNPGSRWEELLGKMALTVDKEILDQEISDELVSLVL